MKPIRIASVAALAAGLAACVPQTRPAAPVQVEPTPTPAPAPLPPAPVHKNWMDAPATPGDWSYTAVGSGGVASFGRFGTSGDEPLFTMTCDRDSRSIGFARTGSSLESTPGRMIIRTETQTQTLSARRSRPTASGRGAATTARIGANDRLLDAMALSKGRFAIEVDNREPLYLPSWAEVTRVIEDCR